MLYVTPLASERCDWLSSRIQHEWGCQVVRPGLLKSWVVGGRGDNKAQITGNIGFLFLTTFVRGTQSPFCEEVQGLTERLIWRKLRSLPLNPMKPPTITQKQMWAVWVSHSGNESTGPQSSTPADTWWSRHGPFSLSPKELHKWLVLLWGKGNHKY